MGTFPVKVLIDENNEEFIPWMSADGIHTSDGLSFEEKFATKIDASNLKEGTGITIVKDGADCTFNVDFGASDNIIDNLDTTVAGQGSLDARQGSVLKGMIPQIVDNTETPDASKVLSANQGHELSKRSVPEGGLTGQVLKKSSDNNHELEWGDAADPNAIVGDGSIMKIIELTYAEYKTLESNGELQDDTEYHINDMDTISGIGAKASQVEMTDGTDVESNIKALQEFDQQVIEYFEVEYDPRLTDVETNLHTLGDDLKELEAKEDAKRSVIISPTEPTTGEDIWIQEGRNIFNKDGFDLIMNVGVNTSVLPTGLRVTVTDAGNYKYNVIALSTELLGKTLTLSSKISASANNKPHMCFYYGTVTSPALVSANVNLSETGSVTFTVVDSFPEGCDTLFMLLYGNTNQTVNVGDYSDYTDLQLEINDHATSFVPYIEDKIFIRDANDNYVEYFKGATETVLYERSQGHNGTITLNESASKFKTIEIFYYNTDYIYDSVKIYEPNGKHFTASTFTPLAADYVYTKHTRYYINNKTISVNSCTNVEYSKTALRILGSTNQHYIYRVIGHK